MRMPSRNRCAAERIVEFHDGPAGVAGRRPHMSKLKEIGIVAALLAISAVPRYAGLGRFTSLDEPFWLRQSSNFYYALGQRDFRNTLYEYHPAVTTMWIISAGMLAYFPEYRALGQGYLKPGKVDEFLVAHGKSMLELLITSRAIQVAVVLGLLLAVYWLLRSLFNRGEAFFAATFVALSPFLIGQSRLLNHEALLALFCVISLLGMLAYLYRSRKCILLLISGAAAGLAQLTKSSGVPIILLIVLVVIVHAFTTKETGARERAAVTLRVLGTWFALAAGTYVVLWPGMWVAPAAMLRDVYGNAFSYALQGMRTSVVSGIQPQGFDLATITSGIGVYVNDLWWRTTPLTGAGLLIGLALAFRGNRDNQEVPYRQLVIYGSLLAIAFVLLFGVQRGPKPPHYVLTAYVALDVIAGLGWARAWRWFSSRMGEATGAAGAAAALGGILTLQLASSQSAFPYYISYYNPLVEALQPGIQNPTLNDTGYGVGLDQAAAYLAQKPDAKYLSVLSSHGLGCFSYYFPGRTVTMNDFSMSDPQVAAIVRESDYVVVDYYNHKRKAVSQDLDGVQPEKSIWINGIEFLRIYPTAAFMHPAP